MKSSDSNAVKLVPFNYSDNGDLESGRKEGIAKGLVLLF